MEYMQFKRPGKELKAFAPNIKSKARIFQNENIFGKTSKTSDNIVIKSYPLQPLICNFSKISLQDESYQDCLTKILTRLETITPINPDKSYNKNEEYSQYTKKLQELSELKNVKIQETKAENEEFDRILSEKTQKIQDLRQKIASLAEKKEAVQKIFKQEKKAQKFFKDLTRFEIIETFPDSKGFKIRVSSDLMFVEFKLNKENETTYEYIPLSTNMNASVIPDVLKSEFSFEENQMREFYFYLLEFIDLN